MAYSYESKWDTDSLKVLHKRLGRVPKEAAKEVSKSNRLFANTLRDHIRAATPATGGGVRYPHPWSRANERKGRARPPSGRKGAMRASVRSRASADSASVVGGGKDRVPWFVANEFGGGAKFLNRAGKKQYIPIRKRSPSLKQLGLTGRGGGMGAGGWFFYPTVRRDLPYLQKQAVDAAQRIVRDKLARPPIA